MVGIATAWNSTASGPEDTRQLAKACARCAKASGAECEKKLCHFLLIFYLEIEESKDIHFFPPQ
jgi:hypothetical protein